MEKNIDVIIFGATGSMGKYAVKNAVKILKGLQWAVAGRNKSKLEMTLIEAGSKIKADLSKIPIIIADVEDEKSLYEMAKQAKVIVNCCEPYNLYGEPVIKACIRNSASYVDISGEAPFIEKILHKYNEAAQERGILVISSCGINSISAELGIFYLQQQFNGIVNSVEIYSRFYFEEGFKPKGFGLNFGYYKSAIETLGSYSETQKLRKKLFPTSIQSFEPKLKNRLIHRLNNRWCLPTIEPDQTTVSLKILKQNNIRIF